MTEELWAYLRIWGWHPWSLSHEIVDYAEELRAEVALLRQFKKDVAALVRKPGAAAQGEAPCK